MSDHHHAQGTAPPRVVIRFEDRVDLALSGDVSAQIERDGVGPWDDLRRDYPGISISHVFSTIPPHALVALAKIAERRDPTYVAPNFFLFYYVDAPAEVDADDLADALRLWPSVVEAYVQRVRAPSIVDPAGDGSQPQQGYQNPAGIGPDPGQVSGIDAEYAWGFSGGGGAGQRLIDIEWGWTIDHQELVDQNIEELPAGTLLDSKRAHGTQVLGVICSTDHPPGRSFQKWSTIGIAPNKLEKVWVVPVNYPPNDDVAGAIVAALYLPGSEPTVPRVRTGDVMLIEVEAELSPGLYGPAEGLSLNFTAIGLATALGVVVVEAAGNGDRNSAALDLDTWAVVDAPENPPKRFLDRSPGNPHYRESHAILVSAASSTWPHKRLEYASEGARVDCYAWGEGVVTASSNHLGNKLQYEFGFGATSAASAIIAGAALVVQGVLVAAGEPRLDSPQMRELLSDEDFGTKPQAAYYRRIGIMPDLRKIIDYALRIGPDVYIRDFVGDVGDPHTQPAATSPDIIVRGSSVGDPMTAFGEGSGAEDNRFLSVDVVQDADHHLYPRVLNRGGTASDDTRVQFYWSPVSTLIRPDDWNKIEGLSTLPTVLEGERLTVGSGVVWPAADIPAPGHYCFIAVVGSVAVPPQVPTAFSDWATYVARIRSDRRLAWRNFNVIDNVPGGSDAPLPSPLGGAFAGIWDEVIALPFRIRGPFDRRRRMRLRIRASLPAGAFVGLIAPASFVDRIPHISGRVHQLEETTRRLVALPVNRPFDLPRRFPRDREWRAQLVVHVPLERRDEHFDVSAAQRWNGTEVGRVTWRLRPRPDAPDAPID